VLLERRLSTGPHFLCGGGPLGTVMLPAAWTDRGEPPWPARLTVEVLVELAALVTAVRG